MEEFMNISKVLQKLLNKSEELGWIYAVHTKPISHKRGCVEMRKCSPAGENFSMVINFYMDDQLASFLKNLRDFVYNFDVDKHVEMILPRRRKGGKLSTIKELVEDTELIAGMLKELYNVLYDVLDSGLIGEQSEVDNDIYRAIMTASKVDRLQATIQIVVTQCDIDDIMASALEGGINYWCSKAAVEDEYLGEYASEQISRGGMLMLHDAVGEREEVLTKEKLLQGIKMYAEQPKSGDIFEVIDHELHIDCGMVDAAAADAIIQYALFGDVVYG